MNEVARHPHIRCDAIMPFYTHVWIGLSDRSDRAHSLGIQGQQESAT